MGMNSIEKILANHSDQSEVKPGDVVVVKVDTAVWFDFMRPDVLKIADPDMVVLCHDHMVPAPTVQAANMAKHMRGFVEKFGTFAAGVMANETGITVTNLTVQAICASGSGVVDRAVRAHTAGGRATYLQKYSTAEASLAG